MAEAPKPAIHWLNPHFVEAQNLLRFDRFMELCLYDEESGYYGRNIRSVGSAGDFSTTPALSPVLADTLVHSIRDSGLRDIIEIGPGTGHLASQLLLRLRPPRLSLRRGIRYHVIERSPSLRALLRKRLRGKATIHADVASALKATGGSAFILSNELVDAFPVRVFRNKQELFLSLRNGIVAEEWHAPHDLPDSTQFITPRNPAQRLEIHDSYRTFMAHWLPFFKKGKLTTIDYGGTASEIYHRKPDGTLRAYYRHQCLTGPDIYRLPGRQDLTADVNFDDLIFWGEQDGLSSVRLTTQHDYCQRWHIMTKPTPENSFLTDPAGAGSAFKVLEQERI